ncbi:hypothetical protein QNI16_07240 [Cytophagaceae bacterium YF14B1]|uniref:Uncharacterized protein n=1 Tax=Xanthocytophaga flava TaxID=3048013 RepID=A0AAE3U7M2_9BACT|nr:hypothetical protein [Xanthocytophaga flavus]MDJ1480273.1 hypothetical protein [Xanthocytophaga flavus]
MDYSDLTGLQGQDNQGGLTQIIYYAPTSYFQVIQDFNPTPEIPGVLEIATAHTFKSGKGFHTAYATLDTAKMMMELTGERDGKGYAPKIEFFHPGTKKQAAGFARQCKNDQFIVLAPNPNGYVFQVGTKNIFAEISAKYDSGTLSSGRNGWTFEVNSYANGMIFYDGNIVLYPTAP